MVDDFESEKQWAWESRLCLDLLHVALSEYYTSVYYGEYRYGYGKEPFQWESEYIFLLKTKISLWKYYVPERS